MKKIFTLVLFISTGFCVLAQAPQKFSYQAVVRNASGTLVTSHEVGVRVSILQGSASGAIVYQEIYNPNPQTNANGLVTLEIGGGIPVSGSFTGINWYNGPYFIKSETDPAGGTSYTITGTSQILSVPYALTAGITENITNNSVTSIKIVDGSVSNADLAANSVDASKIADLSVTGSDLAANSVTSAKIADGTVTAADIQDRTRNIFFPANAINHTTTGTIITQSGTGLRWQANYQEAAYLIIPKPSDWVETSNVTMKLHFAESSNSSGVVAFFIRPRAYSDGDVFTDASPLSPIANTTVPLDGSSTVYSQSFTIPYSRFGTDNLWVITIQRGGTGETYTADVILMAVEIMYTAEQ